MSKIYSSAAGALQNVVADERCLPFEVKVPNKETVAAMKELESGKGKRFISVEDLMADLNADG